MSWTIIRSSFCLVLQHLLQLGQLHHGGDHGSVDVSGGDDVGAECPQCFKILKNPMHLKRHILRQHGSAPFKCETCNQPFKRKDHLVEHRRTHTGEKPYACHLCSYRSTQSSNLKSHIRKKHT